MTSCKQPVSISTAQQESVSRERPSEKIQLLPRSFLRLRHRPMTDARFQYRSSDIASTRQGRTANP